MGACCDHIIHPSHRITSHCNICSVGAFFGALARYQVGRVAAEYIAHDPNRWNKFTGWHTAGINIGGSFLLGGIAACPTTTATTTTTTTTTVKLPQRKLSTKMLPRPFTRTPTTATTSQFHNYLPKVSLSPRTKLMLGVGFCGSYTTFSTYSVDVVNWLLQGETKKALTYVATNNIGGIVAAATGMILVKKFLG